MAVARLDGWEAALCDYIAATEMRPHVWGEHDCALDVADAVLAMTGTDFGAVYRGRYSSAAGAARALKLYGAGTLERTIDALFPVVGVGFARRGDLVLLDDGAIGVVMGAFALVLREGEPGEPAASARMRVPRRDWQKAWAIG